MAALIDVEILEETEDEVRAQVPVTDALRQPLGLVHGGVYATIADTLTARGGRAISNQTSFLRPITGGHDPRHRAPPPQRPHDRGLGGRHHRRRGQALRARADDGLPRSLTEPGLGELAQLRIVRRLTRSAAAATPAPDAAHARPPREDHGLPGGGELRIERT